ncbi:MULTISPECIES: DUF4834 family protein [unclassified Leeuwenhoekiella]|uniref:DUF4834 family protein n=1 Tax=unclassified Leeuwenhoekiella TaxID=2615029 RepID=UPI000C4BA1B1|nr:MULTISPECIES: DUF4834 family protein [unclassified Leeuwenhoekiella]MAW93830.1 DUF4834 domain-containing protein [Leeuwenhoekiella sp.]MBA82237.1 DUF4834 domain-containing protein [Leeuwenhoekiella sp.]|tara:strand:+ start:12368 stop:12628 length:261 start_codon:yes stop_codon:yes gene_type:complete
MKFLQTILIILLIFFALRVILRLAAPYIMRYIAKKAGERFQNMAQGFQGKQNPPQREGETVIDKVPRQDTHAKKNVGEYVDYEEID